MRNNKHVFQLTTEEFVEVIREVVLSVIPPTNNITNNLIGNDDNDGESKYLTRDEVKKLLKVSYTTLWKYNKEGKLPATKIGSRVYYKRKDIDDAMEGGCYA